MGLPRWGDDRPLIRTEMSPANTFCLIMLDTIIKRQEVTGKSRLKGNRRAAERKTGSSVTGKRI